MMNFLAGAALCIVVCSGIAVAAFGLVYALFFIANLLN